MTNRTANHPMNPAVQWTSDGGAAHETGLQVWCTQGPLEALAFTLASELTLDGERVIVVDAAGCFNTENVGQSAIAAATNLEVIRAANTSELQTALWTILQAARPNRPVRRVLMCGVLEHLYGTDLLMREAARALGRMKLAMDAMVKSGIDVAVLCRTRTGELGARSCLLTSLCAVADEVHVFPSTAQQYVDRSTSAIA